MAQTSHARAAAAPFDAVLYVGFGGPEGLDDIRPFLANVLRGRRIPPARIEEVAHHYERFGGVSPITAITERQARALEAALRARGLALPVRVGTRNWRPMLADTCRALHAAGARRLLMLIAAAHRSYSSCEQYKQNLWQVQEELAAEGLPPFDIAYAADWHLAPGVLDAVAERIAVARATLPDAVRDRARLVFTAHSIPTTMPAADRYVMQLRDSAASVAALVHARDWALVFQSRSGRPEDPWLEPDVNDYLRDARAKRPRGGDPRADRLPRRSRRGALRPRRRGARDRRRDRAGAGPRRGGQRPSPVHRGAGGRGERGGGALPAGTPAVDRAGGAAGEARAAAASQAGGGDVTSKR